MHSNSPVLTIIIPHYNVREYMNCLYELLFPQISDSVELILIEDCSTDGTRENMQRWEKKNNNPNIKFIYLEKNLGLSGARNKGISLAIGEYLWFIDSDDTVDENAIAYLLDIIRSSKPDAIVFDFLWLHGNFEECNNDTQNLWIERSKQRSFPHKKLLTDTDFILQSLFSDEQMYVWSFIIKKSFWYTNLFPVGRKFEDVATVPKILSDIKSLFYFPQPLLYYRQREGSILSKPTVDSCLNMPEAMREIAEYFKDKILDTQTFIALYTFYLKMLRWSYNDLMDNGLMDSSVLEKYYREENTFSQMLPWSESQFLSKIKMGTKSKFTSWLFIYHKKLYTLMRKIMK